MPPQTLQSRVESLEHRLMKLEELPGRIDDLTLEVSQLRTEMSAEFSAVRAEMRAEFSALRAEIAERSTGSEMRALHEDVISRIALLQEAWAPPHKPRSRKK